MKIAGNDTTDAEIFSARHEPIWIARLREKARADSHPRRRGWLAAVLAGHDERLTTRMLDEHAKRTKAVR